MTLTDRVELIHSREDFVEFIQELACDLKEHPEKWENSDLASFLNATAAWIQDMDGYFVNRSESIPQQLNWKLLGQIFLAGLIYE